MKGKEKEKRWIQLDVRDTDVTGFVRLDVYFGGHSYQAYMPEPEYNLMLNDGCFVRDGKTLDGAGVRNTTDIFYEKDEDI